MAMKNQWVMPPVPMAGITLFEEEFSFVPDGDYRCSLVDSEDWADPGQAANTVMFNARIEEDGSAKGAMVSLWLGKDTNKEGNQRSWKALYTSVGAQPAALEGNIQPDPAHFFTAGQPLKTCYVRVRNKTPFVQGQKRDAKDTDRKFISPAAYAEAKKRPTPVPMAASGFVPAGGAPGMPTQAAAPTFSAPAAPFNAQTPQPPASPAPIMAAPQAANGVPQQAAPAVNLFGAAPQ